MTSLLEPITLGDSLPLRNRVCMGALTRNRCIDDSKPTDSTVRHYADRARDGVGLIVAEGTAISLHGLEWPDAPMMTEQAHVDAWRKVTEAVHVEGGRIFFQPWHPGRVQNDEMPLLKTTGYPVYSSSPIPAPGGKYRMLEGLPGHTANVTQLKDPGLVVEQFRHSVALAKDAGFDGVELLAQGHANKRTDKYGGSVENRCRFALEVVDAIISVWGPRRTGIKICPADVHNASTVTYQEATDIYSYLIPRLVARKLCYINVSRRGCNLGKEGDHHIQANPRPKGYDLPEGYEPIKQFGHLIKYPGSETSLMVNHMYTPAEADELVKNGKIDIVCFGRPFIHNPDVINRIRKGVPFAENTRGSNVNYGPFQHPDEFYNDWPCAGA
ncbi:hypothetical protein KEM56_003536 [Ascosphaera pollenicola]|nr:hypothetical protein KEM56_003536 [Ascosphaera pollenicola]